MRRHLEISKHLWEQQLPSPPSCSQMIAVKEFVQLLVRVVVGNLEECAYIGSFCPIVCSLDEDKQVTLV